MNKRAKELKWQWRLLEAYRSARKLPKDSVPPVAHSRPSIEVGGRPCSEAGELEYPGSSEQGREPLVNQQDNLPASGAGGSVTNRACGVGLVTPAVAGPTGTDQDEVNRPKPPDTSPPLGN